MFLILKIIYNALEKFDEQHRDRRTDDYPIVRSPLQVVLLPVLYYVFVKHLGPKLMEKRKPFVLKNIILLYNVIQVFLNSYIVVNATYMQFGEFSHLPSACRMPTTDGPKSLIELKLSYLYFLLKYIDYLDTVFMVLRKRNKQISFLHVYHHIMVSVGCFGGMRYIPGGHSVAFGVTNSIVHAIMYSYYFISALKPELKNSLWWKKHITQIQLLQFIFLAVHFTRPLVQKNCNFPAVPSIVGVTQSLTMILLFGDFYRRTYLRKTVK